jgi:glucokinase
MEAMVTEFLTHVSMSVDVASFDVASPVINGHVKTTDVPRAGSKWPHRDVAPGTGLGESFLIWNGSQYVAHSSEGGHADFTPTDERQIRLLHYLLPLLGMWGGTCLLGNWRSQHLRISAR